MQTILELMDLNGRHQTMERVASLAEVLDRYDLYLLDQFGVLHDGLRPYQGSRDALRALKQAGKTIIIISNSGKRADTNIRRMEADLTAHCTTIWSRRGKSLGEVLARTSPELQQRRCLLISSGVDGLALSRLGIDRVDDAANCDLVLIAGGEGQRVSEDDYRAMLRPAADRGVDCICSNPDMISIEGDHRFFGPGRIAETIENSAARFVSSENRTRDLYEFALSQTPGIDRSRVLCVGDSIEHDIAGAVAAGLDGMLVTEGILRGLTTEELRALSVKHAVSPHFLLNSLTI